MATKTKNTYAVNYYANRDDYDNNNATVLGYVSSVSMRGAEILARKSIAYPSGGWVSLENITRRAEQDQKNLLAEQARQTKRANSGLTYEELNELEAHFRDEEKRDIRAKLEVKLSQFDRAIQDAHSRITWDKLESENPELHKIYTALIESAEVARVPFVEQLRTVLEVFGELSERCFNAGVIDEEVYRWHTYALTRFHNKEAERGE